MKRELKEALFIILGTVLAALAFKIFLVPNEIAPGGVSGVATFLHYLFGFPVGTLILTINIPIFIFGVRTLGISFGLRSLIGTILLSVFVDMLVVPSATANPLLASIYGGIMLGTGLGLVFVGGGSTGGTDILAKIVNLKLPGLPMGTSVLVLDFIIIVAFAIRFGIEQALYSLITVFLSSRVIDFVVEGTVSAKAYYVISSQYVKISQQIQTELDRGVTAISAKGMYSGEDKCVLLCLVNRFEASAVKRIVRQCDKHAFIFVSDVREVQGEGFSADGERIETRLMKQIKERRRKKK